jgi:hypothetical protein
MIACNLKTKIIVEEHIYGIMHQLTT